MLWGRAPSENAPRNPQWCSHSNSEYDAPSAASAWGGEAAEEGDCRLLCAASAATALGLCTPDAAARCDSPRYASGCGSGCGSGCVCSTPAAAGSGLSAPGAAGSRTAVKGGERPYKDSERQCLTWAAGRVRRQVQYLFESLSERARGRRLGFPQPGEGCSRDGSARDPAHRRLETQAPRQGSRGRELLRPRRDWRGARRLRPLLHGPGSRRGGSPGLRRRPACCRRWRARRGVGVRTRPTTGEHPSAGPALWLFLR